MIGKTEYSWEQNHGVVDEGPYVVMRNGGIYMTYSGAAVDNTYSVGLLRAKMDANLLDFDSWTKNNYPILNSASVEGEYGPGHSCFMGQDNGDLLFIYHGRGPEWNSKRTVGIRRVQFDIDGEPNLTLTDERDVLAENRTISTTVIVKPDTISINNAVVGKISAGLYTGKACKPTVKVIYAGKNWFLIKIIQFLMLIISKLEGQL